MPTAEYDSYSSSHQSDSQDSTYDYSSTDGDYSSTDDSSNDYDDNYDDNYARRRRSAPPSVECDCESACCELCNKLETFNRQLSDYRKTEPGKDKGEKHGECKNLQLF